MEAIVRRVRARAPLIHCITNPVTVNDCANSLLACGASPVMADDEREVAEITAISDGLTLNLGTLSEPLIAAMRTAGRQANTLGRPVVLDPVGAGASRLRTETAFSLLDTLHIDVIRGNMSEIMVLAGCAARTHGVDADASMCLTDETLGRILPPVQELARRYGTVVAMTGATDLVCDASTAYVIRNGHPMLPTVTGTGCQLSAITAAFVAANPERTLAAAAAAVCAMGLAGELAARRLGPLDGNATYRTYVIDALFTMTPGQFGEGARYEMR